MHNFAILWLNPKLKLGTANAVAVVSMCGSFNTSLNIWTHSLCEDIIYPCDNKMNLLDLLSYSCAFLVLYISKSTPCYSYSQRGLTGLYRPFPKVLLHVYHSLKFFFSYPSLFGIATKANALMSCFIFQSGTSMLISWLSNGRNVYHFLYIYIQTHTPTYIYIHIYIPVIFCKDLLSKNILNLLWSSSVICLSARVILISLFYF